MRDSFSLGPDLYVTAEAEFLGCFIVIIDWANEHLELSLFPDGISSLIYAIIILLS